MELTAGDYRLELAPERGGSILAFEWRGEPIMRPARDGSVLETACFPLVPFSNRIANGRFTWDGSDVRLVPNLPGSDHRHPLHGFGWLAPWTVAEVEPRAARLVHEYPGGHWPWPYCAKQHFKLTEMGLTVALSLTNLGTAPMPAGLGLHPYFPRSPTTRYLGLHRGEWQTDAECLPVGLIEGEPRDWWHGRPVSSRVVDTCYTGRSGPLRIDWPERGMALQIAPSDNLSFTVVFAPAGEDFFCLEPVSNMSDAVNRVADENGLIKLGPGATFEAEVRFSVNAANPSRTIMA